MSDIDSDEEMMRELEALQSQQPVRTSATAAAAAASPAKFASSSASGSSSSGIASASSLVSAMGLRSSCAILPSHSLRTPQLDQTWDWLEGFPGQRVIGPVRHRDPQMPISIFVIAVDEDKAGRWPKHTLLVSAGMRHPSGARHEVAFRLSTVITDNAQATTVVSPLFNCFAAFYMQLVPSSSESTDGRREFRPFDTVECNYAGHADGFGFEARAAIVLEDPLLSCPAFPIRLLLPLRESEFYFVKGLNVGVFAREWMARTKNVAGITQVGRANCLEDADLRTHLQTALAAAGFSQPSLLSHGRLYHLRVVTHAVCGPVDAARRFDARRWVQTLQLFIEGDTLHDLLHFNYTALAGAIIPARRNYPHVCTDSKDKFKLEMRATGNDAAAGAAFSIRGRPSTESPWLEDIADASIGGSTVGSATNNPPDLSTPLADLPPLAIGLLAPSAFYADLLDACSLHERDYRGAKCHPPRDPLEETFTFDSAEPAFAAIQETFFHRPFRAAQKKFTDEVKPMVADHLVDVLAELVAEYAFDQVEQRIQINVLPDDAFPENVKRTD